MTFRQQVAFLTSPKQKQPQPARTGIKPTAPKPASAALPECSRCGQRFRNAQALGWHTRRKSCKQGKKAQDASARPVPSKPKAQAKAGVLAEKAAPAAEDSSDEIFRVECILDKRFQKVGRGAHPAAQR